jgi:hypothetical protein
MGINESSSRRQRQLPPPGCRASTMSWDGQAKQLDVLAQWLV